MGWWWPDRRASALLVGFRFVSFLVLVWQDYKEVLQHNTCFSKGRTTVQHLIACGWKSWVWSGPVWFGLVVKNGQKCRGVEVSDLGRTKISLNNLFLFFFCYPDFVENFLFLVVAHFSQTALLVRLTRRTLRHFYSNPASDPRWERKYHRVISLPKLPESILYDTLPTPWDAWMCSTMLVIKWWVECHGTTQTMLPHAFYSTHSGAVKKLKIDILI